MSAKAYPVLTAFDRLFGVFPHKIPMALYGPPMAGKTLLTIQLAAEIMSMEKRNVLWLDTEGGMNYFLSGWYNVFKRRYQLPDEVKIRVEDSRSISNLLRLHGIDHRLNISKEGKMENIVSGFIENTVEKLVKTGDVCLIVYDSLTNPLRTAFTGGRVNFPARADAVNMLFLQIQNICSDYDVKVITTHHQTVDPARPWEKPVVTLGAALLHNIKVVAYIEKIHSKKYPELRRLTLVRWFNAKPWEKQEYLNLSDEGFEEAEVA